MTKAEQLRKREEWQEKVAEFRASGLSGAAWCTAEGIKPHMLYYWTKQFPQKTEVPAQTHPQWLPVVIGDRQTEEMANGLQVRIGSAVIDVRPGFDGKLLSDIVRVLMTQC
jgi:hypothetical protein